MQGINQVRCESEAEHDFCEMSANEFFLTVRCVEPPKPMYVHMYNLCGQRMLIEREHKGQCWPVWSVWRCAGVPQVLDDEHPDIILTMPGRYRFSTESGIDFDELDEDIRIEASEISLEYAMLRLREMEVCCCLHKECEKNEPLP